MKIAIDISPLKNANKVRGVGFYVQHLKDALEKYFPQHRYTFFTSRRHIPEHADVIHYPYFDPFARSLPLFPGRKTVITIHDLTPLVFPEQFPHGRRGELIWRMQRHAAKRAGAIITDSHCSQKDIVKFLDYPEEKVSVVYLAASTGFRMFDNGSSEGSTQRSKIQDLRSRYGLPEKFVLYVGDVTPNKNLPRLVRAMQKADIPLVLAGKALARTDYDRSNPWTNDLQEVQQLAEGDERIHILGFVPDDDLVALYNIATVFVMPSLYEGFGLPVLEAMQSGCPVITTTQGSLSEVAGDAAYYIDAFNTDVMSQEITKVFNDTKLQHALSKKGLERAKEFSWRKTAADTLKVYEKVVAG